MKVSRRTLIFLHLHSPAWLGISEQLLSHELAQGREVEIVDISSFSIPSGAVFSHFVKSRPMKRFLQTCSDLGGTYRVLRRPTNNVAIKKARNESSTIDMQVIYEAILSHISTLLRFAKPMESSLGKLLFRAQERRVLRMNEALDALVQGHSKANLRVIVPAGRYPSNRFVGEYFLANGIEVKWAETDLFGGLFLENYRRHDRLSTLLAFQAHENKCEHNHSEAERYLRERVNLAARHQHSLNFKENNPKPELTFDNVFLPSSPDEYSFLGKGWTDSHWDSPFRAFSQILSVIDPAGERSVLRLHPIFRTKSYATVLGTYRELVAMKRAHPRLKIIPSESEANTYDLIRGSKRVIVARSSTSIEATYMGKPVWQTWNHILEGTFDVATVYSSADVSEENFLIYQPRREKTLCAVDFILKRSRPIENVPKYLGGKIGTLLLTLDSAFILIITALWRRTFLYKPLGVFFRKLFA